MSTSEVRVLQVSNISPSAAKDQIQSLFSYVGRIDECRVYAPEGGKEKFAYVKFDRESAVELGQHLTNMVFIDRALVCVPAQSNVIPDEESALRTGPVLPGQRQLPPNVTNEVRTDGDGSRMLYTTDPTITALGLTQYPPLPADTEPGKVEEIRRTVYVGNLDKSTDGDAFLKFLNATIGEVMYIRMTAANDALPCLYAYVEFSNQESVPLALQNNGIDFNGRALKIQHSRVAIIKPKQKTANQALEEIEEAIRIGDRVDDTKLGRGYSPTGGSGSGGGSRSGSRRRSTSPRERSPRRRRSNSRDHRDSRDRDAERSKEKERSSRDHDRDTERRDRDKDHGRRRSRERRRTPERTSSRDAKESSRRRSPDSRSSKRSSRDKDKDRKSEKDRKRSRSPKKSHKRKSRSPSPKKSKKSEKEKRRSKSVDSENEEEILRRRLLERANLPTDN